MNENKQAQRDQKLDYPTSSVRRDSYVESSRESSIPAGLTLCMEYARVNRDKTQSSSFSCFAHIKYLVMSVQSCKISTCLP
jgi:hypothetical protein